ncbi:hypothetical protein [Gymnodinialimonas sp.]
MRGTTHGTLTGIAAAEMAFGQTWDTTGHFAAEAAPARVPPQPVRDFSVDALIRWQEWRARAQ